MQQTLKKNYNLIRKTTCCVLYRKFTFTLSKYSWYSDVSSNWLQYIKLNRFTYERTHCQSRKKRIVRQKHFIESEPFQHTNTIFSYIYFFVVCCAYSFAVAVSLLLSLSTLLFLSFFWLSCGCHSVVASSAFAGSYFVFISFILVLLSFLT